MPVCVVEDKNPKDGGAIERSITQLRRCEKETPELPGAPQLFNLTHLLWAAQCDGVLAARFL